MEKDFVKERIRYYRQKHNMSARNLSLELGMSTEYINQLETGRMAPSIYFIEDFCDYFNITMGEFFDDSIKYPEDLKDMIKNLNKLSPDELELVKNLIKSLVINKSNK